MESRGVYSHTPFEPRKVSNATAVLGVDMWLVHFALTIKMDLKARWSRVPESECMETGTDPITSVKLFDCDIYRALIDTLASESLKCLPQSKEC